MVCRPAKLSVVITRADVPATVPSAATISKVSPLHVAPSAAVPLAIATMVVATPAVSAKEILSLVAHPVTRS